MCENKLLKNKKKREKMINFKWNFTHLQHGNEFDRAFNATPIIHGKIAKATVILLLL